ncbi:polysaccharide biosynthesis protein [Spirosoma harenae]
MKKFAFLVHMRSSYSFDLSHMASPLGWIPDSAYRYAFRNRPFPPFIWSDVTLTPGATEPEGYIIMLPYTGRQLLEQQKPMLPLVEKAIKLAASKGAEILGLGALSSPITLGGKLVANNPYLSVTNGNAYTAVITHERVAQLIEESPAYRPVVALVGATGSVGTLVSTMLAKNNPEAEYMLVARNERRLVNLANEMKQTNYGVQVSTSQNIDDIKRADIIVLLTSAADCLLESHHLKANAIVLDDTVPRNTHPRLLTQRPDVKIIDGGMVSVPNLKTNSRGIGLPRGLSYACLAETMLLAKAGYNGDFSVGNPTLEQAEYIRSVAYRFSHLGFDVAPDHSFGRLLTNTPASSAELAETLAV